jgi:hypothetical protein
VTLGLAAGKVMGDVDWLNQHFAKKGWILWDPSMIRKELEALRHVGFENSIASVVTKLLLSNSASKKPVIET